MKVIVKQELSYFTSKFDFRSYKNAYMVVDIGVLKLLPIKLFVFQKLAIHKQTKLKGVSSKPSRKMILGPEFCFSS